MRGVLEGQRRESRQHGGDVLWKKQTSLNEEEEGWKIESLRKVFDWVRACGASSGDWVFAVVRKKVGSREKRQCGQGRDLDVREGGQTR